MTSRAGTLSAFLVVGTILMATGCKGSNSITGAHVTPIDTPLRDIAGAWTGTFDSADFVDCDSDTPAQATFDVNGSTVTGLLSATFNGCGFSNATFQGTLAGTTLTGIIAPGSRFTNATVTGTLSATTLEVRLNNGAGLIPGGTMHLHR